MQTTTTHEDVSSPQPPEAAREPAPVVSDLYAYYVLAVMFVVTIFNFIDRQILAILLQPIKEDLQVSDTAMGFLTGFAFAAFYTFAGLPLARLADRWVRRSLIAISLATWSAMTAASGLARNFTDLAIARIGVGIGEAGGSPPAQSLLMDYFPPEKRATALSLFACGVNVGVGLGFWLGGWINDAFGWRAAFFVVGLPGVVMALVVRFTVRELPRGWREQQTVSILAEAALLAYAQEAFIRSVFDGISLRPAGFQVEFFSSASTQCFVASNKTFVIVAFRGTEVRRQSNVNFRNIVADIVTDIKWHPVDSEQGGNVHRGFKDALDEIWDRPTSTPYGESLKTCLGRVRKTADQTLRPLWFTGHSLGAALATLAADRYGSVQGLYTFGSPRVGDSTFQADFHVNTYRFVNNNDIVTQLPSIGLFQHVGQLKYIDSAGVLHDNPDLWTRLKELFRGVFGHMFTSAGQLRSGFTGEIPIDHLTDHAPLYYALHTWDSYVAEQEDETASGGG